jgi:hypothetical protein
MAPLTPLERAVRFVQSLLAVPKAIWNSLATGKLGAPLRWLGSLFGWYKRRIWNRYTRNAAGEQTAKRVGLTFAGTLVFLWLLPGIIAGVFSTVLIATTLHTETAFLTQTEEIDPDGDVHSIKGCRAIPCSESDAIYYRVRPDWAHSFYSYFTTGGPFFPDLTASVVAPGVNKCSVTSYGFRMRLLRGWGIYPDMLDATCEPYTIPNGAPAGVVPTAAP